MQVFLQLPEINMLQKGKIMIIKSLIKYLSINAVEYFYIFKIFNNFFALFIILFFILLCLKFIIESFDNAKIPKGKFNKYEIIVE